jgi:hypothetical protein
LRLPENSLSAGHLRPCRDELTLVRATQYLLKLSSCRHEPCFRSGERGDTSLRLGRSRLSYLEKYLRLRYLACVFRFGFG